MGLDVHAILNDSFDRDHNRTDKVYNVPVDNIEPDPNQPRKEFDPEALQELAADIKQNGLIQPIVVKYLRADGFDAKYRLVSGERRWRAVKLIGQRMIRAILTRAEDGRVGFLQMAENVKRENLSIPEIAAFIAAHLPPYYQQPKDEEQIQAVKKAKQKVGSVLGFSSSKMSFYMAYLNAPSWMQEAVQQKKITSDQALAALYAWWKKQPGQEEKIKAWLQEKDFVSRMNILAKKKEGWDAEEKPEKAISAETMVMNPEEFPESGPIPSGMQSNGERQDRPTESAEPAAMALTEEEQETVARREQEQQQEHLTAAADEMLTECKPKKLRHPLLLAQWTKTDGSTHAVELLLVQPEHPGFGRIHSSEEGIDQEVPLETLQLTLLREA